MSGKLKVLVVDDSRVYRALVANCLDLDKYELSGSVFNGLKAIEALTITRPNVVTLDLDMPVMDGISTLKAIMKFNQSTPNLPPIEVIMLSSFTKKNAAVTIEALELGAFDFIEKPSSSNESANETMLKTQLSQKLRLLDSKRHNKNINSTIICSDVVNDKSSVDDVEDISPCVSKRTVRAIVIGVSTGGPKALNDMLPRLCETTNKPIFIVQHMPKGFTASLAEQLDKKCSHSVIEATDGMGVSDNTVYIAPGGKHMLIKQTGAVVQILLNSDQPEAGCRPSANVLFRSAATVYAANSIGIILTGMGDDGTAGLSELKKSGAYVVAQNEESSVVWGMAGSAVASGNVDVVRSLTLIPDAVKAVLN